MFAKGLLTVSAFTEVIAVGLSSGGPVASDEFLSTVEAQAQFLPIQSISYEFGSKFTSGYFVKGGATCLVTLMVTEKSDPELLSQSSATRVRLVLYPGQVAGLDSEEGHSLNFTCGQAATTLFVDVGERDKLVGRQALAVERTLAQQQ